MDLWQMSSGEEGLVWHVTLHIYMYLWIKELVYVQNSIIFSPHIPPNWFGTGIKKLVRGLTSRGLRQPSVYHQKLVLASWIN